MDHRRIGDILVADAAVTPEDLRAGLALQAEAGGRIGLTLVRIGAVDETALLDALSRQLDLPVSTAADLPSRDETRAAMQVLGAPLTWWIERRAVPVLTGTNGDARLTIHAEDPLDPALREVVAAAARTPVSFALAPAEALRALLAETEAGDREIVDADMGDARRLREMAEEAPVIDFVNAMFAEALRRGASDVHVEPYEGRFAVRMRTDGVLDVWRTGARAQFDAVASRIKLLSGMDIGERRLPQDGRQTIRAGGREIDLRVSTLPASWGESIVLRLLGKTRSIPQLAELGASQAHQDLLLTLIQEPNGVVLVTGPTGSGKTTTIYRLIQHLADGARKIITIEDPVEFDLPGVVQVPVRSDIGVTFAAALRSVLRQDPDVILVGEIRDGETARIAVQAALTGHLVITTVHTNSALAGIPRLMDLGVDDFLLSDVLRGVVAQRLVRRLCPVCSKPAEADEAAALDRKVAKLGIDPSALGPANWRDPVGCDACNGTGYKGRLAVYEATNVTDEMRRAIRRGAPEAELAEIARAHGFLTLSDDGLLKARQGLTSWGEVARVAGG